MNIKRFYLNKKASAILLSCTLVTTSLLGCGKKKEPTLTLVESVQANYYFDLLQDENSVIITTMNAMGEEDIKFAKKISLFSLIEKQEYKNLEKYNKYSLQGYPNSGTIFYFDALEGDILSVKYTYKESHKYKDDEVKSTYRISEIVDEDCAYNYAVLYFGDKERYTREEMEELINYIKENKDVKTYSKSKVK